jgi:uncharacterized coiled-coil protein SlyX
MKTIKIYTLLFGLLIFTTSSTLGQRPANFSKIVTENIVSSLNHEVEGVVEATIYNSVFLAKYYPDAELGKVIDELNDIVVNSNNPVLKYKAQLAVLYLTNYNSNELNLENYKSDQAKLFRDIAEMLENNLLASN